MNAHQARVGRAARRFFAPIGFFLLLNAALLSPVHGASSAVGWIEAQAQSGGILAASVEPASEFQSTAEALLALDWQESSTVASPATNYLIAQNTSTVESLVRQILVANKAGQPTGPFITSLLAHQNLDGGFGEASGYQSTSLDTAAALEALAATGGRGTSAASRAIQYLLSVQFADGGYRLEGDENGSVYVTAGVLRVLSRYRVEYNVNTAVSKAISFLEAQLQPGGGWGSDWETAVALRALAPVGADATRLAAAADVLRANQLADGSWEGSVYVTALAMQAIRELEAAPPPPPPVSEGMVSGRVLDAESGLPIMGAMVGADGGGRISVGADGAFALAGLSAGSHIIEISADGYSAATATVNVTSGGAATLGHVLLSPLPNTGFIRGVITNAENGLPLAGVGIAASGASSASTQTDQAGNFTLVMAPGPVSVTAVASGFEPVTGAGTVIAGASLWFSPTLLAAGTQPQVQTVKVEGSVIDDVTGQRLDAVAVSITVGSGHWSALSDAAGGFMVEGIDAGEETITLVKAGYQTLTYTALAGAGNIVNLGTARMTPNVVATSATVAGRVMDADSSLPVAGADVRIPEAGLGAVSAQDGTYTIQGVQLTQFTITANAPGYVSTSGAVELAQFGMANVDLQLSRAASPDFDVVRVETDASNYPALSKVNIVATLGNTGVEARTVVLQVNVINEAGTSVEQYPAVRIPMGGNPQDAWVTIDAGSERPVPLEWNTDRYGAGQYRLVIEALEVDTGRMLGQRAGVVAVDSTRRMGGSVAFEPPIAQLAAKQPIQVTSLLSNQGNEPISASTVSARVTLQREGYRSRTDLVEVKTVANLPPLMSGRGMAAGADGSFYVGDSAHNKILRVLPTGAIETFADNLPPVDVDVMQGKVYALRTNGTIEVFDEAGVRSSIVTGLAGALSLKVLDDGRILIGMSAGSIYERTTDGQLHKLSGAGLVSPLGLIEAPNGDLIIADAGQNALVRYTEGKLTPFLTGLNQPYGLAMDSGGSLYVATFGANTLYKVGADGQSTVVSSNLGGPYDVKLRQDGAVLVSNNNTNSIVAVAQDGSVTEIAGRTIYNPTAAVYDAAGSLRVANSGYANIVSLTDSGQVTEFKGGVSTVNDMVVTTDGGLAVLQSNGVLSIMSPQGDSRVLATGLSGGNAISSSGDGGWFVAQNSSSKISKISADGLIETHIAGVIGAPRVVRAMSDGGFYVASSDGALSHIAADGRATVIARGLSTPYGLAIDDARNLYVSEMSQKRIAKISPVGEITRTSVSFSPGALTILPDGSLLAAQWASTVIHRMDAAGAWSPFVQADYAIQYDILADADGTLWVPHYGYGRLTRFAPDLVKTTYSLPGSTPYSVNSDGSGGVYVATYGRISHVSDAGVVSTALTHPVLNGQYQVGAFRNNDGVLTTIDSLGRVSRFDSVGNLVGRYASLVSPTGLAGTKDGLMVAGNNMVLLYRDPSRLGEIVATGAYVRLASAPDGTVLMATTANVSRLSVDYKTVESVASGYSNIRGLAVSATGTIAVTDFTSNRLAFHAANGSLIDGYYGLVGPKGLLLDASGDLLVINSNPAGVMKVRDDGKLSMFYSTLGAERMLLEPDGTILVGGGGYIRKLSATGTLLASHTTTALLDLVRAQDGHIYTTANNGRIFSIDGTWAERQVAGGLSSPADIAIDSTKVVHVVDSSRGVVNQLHEDGSLKLVASGLSQAKAIAFDTSDALHVAYGSGQLAVFDTSGRRTELPAISGIGPYTALAVSPAGKIHAMAPSRNVLVQFTTAPAAVAQPGEVVYSASSSIPPLGMDGAAVPVDFGAWIPAIAGDYLVEVSSGDGSTQGVLSNTLHVGPNAEAALALDRSKVLPGDREAAGQLTVIGADSTSITQIDPTGATLAASSNAYGRAIAADSKGNIYAADTNRIVKISPDGQLSNFIAGINVGNGMAVDSKDFIYIVSSNNVAKLSPDGNEVARYVVAGSARAVAVGYDDTVYAITSNNALLRINQNGSSEVITTVGLSSPMGLTIDAYGNFYVLNTSHTIVRITPDGSSSTRYFDKALFEYEGVNVVADCSNNLLFAPISLPPFKQNGEEDIIVQLVGDTGEVRQVLHGPSIDKTLTDIDVLFYDRFGKRLLMWGDVYGGKIFSFPLKCGGIDAEAHLVARPDVDLSSTDPAPDQVLERADGAREYVWALEEVDNRGRTIALNMLFHGMTEGEERPMVQEAFLAYGNSFAPGEQVKVPISIPKLLASSQMTITPTLSGDAFGSDTTVPITVQVENGGERPFDGAVDLVIVDGSGRTVAELAQIAVSQLAGFTSDMYPAAWNTASTFAGAYAVKTTLTNAAGMPVASGSAVFSIEAGSLPGSANVGVSLVSDRATYNAWDSVVLSFAVSNGAKNSNAGPGTVELLVTDPLGMPIHTAIYPMLELLPGGRSTYTDRVALVDAATGGYSVAVTVRSAATGLELANATAGFSVEASAAQALVGSVQVQSAQTNPGESNHCTETVTNRGAETLTGVTVLHRLANLDTGLVVAESTHLVDITGGTSVTSIENVDTATLPVGGYACLLSVEVAGETSDLAQDSFQVRKPPVNIDADIHIGEQGRVLVLMDRKKHRKGHEDSDDHHHHDDRSACRAQTVVNLEQAYGRRLTAGARVDTELLDRHGALLDSESVHVSADVLPHNHRAGSGDMDLVVELLDDTRIGLAVGYSGNGHDCSAHAARLRLSVWQDGALLPLMDSDEASDGGLLTRAMMLSAANDDDAGDSGDGRHAPDADAQRTHLESLLQAAGWNYTVVTDGEDFAREMRSGGYVAYALFSGQEKLSEQVQKELREAVYRGEGLLVAGAHDERNGRLDAALGIQYKGKHSSAAGIRFEVSPLELEGQHAFGAEEQPARIRLDGALVAARYLSTPRHDHDDRDHEHGHDSDHDRENDRSQSHDHGDECRCDDRQHGDHDRKPDTATGHHDEHGDDEHCDSEPHGDDDIAVAYHTYGQGRSVYAGFDLLAQAAGTGAAPGYDQLLLKALAHIQPKPLPLQAGSIVPVSVVLSNQGMAVPTRLLVALPAGSTVFDAPGASTEPDGRLSWTFILFEQANVEFKFWVRLPGAEGAISIDALIQAAAGGNFVDYGTLSLPLMVTGNALAQVRAELDALSGKDFRKARQEIAKAEEYLDKGKAEKALHHLVQAADVLAGIAGSQAAAIRLQVAVAVREVALGAGG
jgi:hypothetical protein